MSNQNDFQKLVSEAAHLVKKITCQNDKHIFCGQFSLSLMFLNKKKNVLQTIIHDLPRDAIC